jgi:Ala-tRNA(Pro) deacylase
MGISLTVQKYIEGQGVTYEVATHERTTRSSDTAKVGSIPANSLAKSVLITCQDGFLLAILPACRHVRLQALSLASEADAARIFADCAVGSLPPLPAAYGLTGVDSLEGCNDIYFEGGDHSSLVHLSGASFQRLLGGVPHAHISVRNH